jgi:hypothetical protein
MKRNKQRLEVFPDTEALGMVHEPSVANEAGSFRGIVVTDRVPLHDSIDAGQEPSGGKGLDLIAHIIRAVMAEQREVQAPVCLRVR